MQRIKNYFSGNVFRVKILLVAMVLLLASAPGLYAQFARIDGDSDEDGWGYGYGYGYGLGYGFDEGTVAGYRTGGDDLDQYGYGYGYGYLPEGMSYDSELGYEVTEDNMADLVLAGIIVPNGGDITSTTELTFASTVTMTVAGGVATVTIPEGTTFTADEAGDFSALAANGTDVDVSIDIDIAGAITFGVPSLDLTVAPAITISVNVGAEYNGDTLNIYRADAAGWNEDAVDTCLVAAGLCEFTTTHLSTFATGTESTTVAPGGAGGGGGGGFIPPAQACTAVTYGDWAACTNSYKFRPIATRTPANCVLTTEQQVGAQEYCGTTPEVTVGMGADAVNAVMEKERALVTKVNAALTQRLSGRILLQVEEKGQAWYLEPLSGTRFFMGRPADAFAMMRRFGLGINEVNFANFEKNGVPAKYAGRIFLRVEKNGEAYYVNPVNMKLNYLGRPADAFKIMRELALGITNANIRQIQVGK